MIMLHLSATSIFFFFFNIGTVLIKSNSGQLMLVSPQQPVTRAETTSTIISRPALPTNPQTVKICAMPVTYLDSFFLFSFSLIYQVSWFCHLLIAKTIKIQSSYSKIL